MIRLPVAYHIACCLIRPTNRDDIAYVDQFGEDYPIIPAHRGRMKMAGGWAKFETDDYPDQTLTRELEEEFTGTDPPNHDKSRDFAPLDLRRAFLHQTLNTVEPFGDFHIRQDPPEYEKPHDSYLVTAFQARVEPPLFDSVRTAIDSGQQVTNESYSRIITEEELQTRVVEGAGGHSSIMGQIFAGSIVHSVPEVPCVTVHPLIRSMAESYAFYAKRYEYPPERALYIRDPF